MPQNAGHFVMFLSCLLPRCRNDHVEHPEDQRHQRAAENDGRGRAVLDDRHSHLAPAITSDDRFEQQEVGTHHLRFANSEIGFEKYVGNML